jgi:hypothetical protein
MWGQQNSKYAATLGTQLLAKIHVLDNKIGCVNCQQNHPVNRLDEHIDFISDTLDHVGKMVNELNTGLTYRTSRSRNWPIWSMILLGRPRSR